MRAHRAEQPRPSGPDLLTHIMSRDDVWAMKKAGLRVEDLGNEVGPGVSRRTFAAMVRDRDAIKAHLSWHHESMNHPDVGTIVERALAAMGQTPEAMAELWERLLRVETNQVLREAGV